jgi:calcineurin-like phosphoesterase family protein
VSTTRACRPFTTVALPDGFSSSAFSFAVLGDAQPLLPRMPLSAVTAQVMRELALLRPAFVLYTGDRIWGYRHTRQEMLNEYERFRALADSTGVPFYATPGNHEMQSDPLAVAIMEERGEVLYGSFDFGPYHFVALNTDEVDREWRVTGAQLRWLRGDLACNEDAAAIFVFMHRPLFSWFQWEFNPEDSEILQGLFRSHPVKAVFAGHDHLYHEEERDGVRYVTTGGGGGSLYAEPQRGGFAHYLLVTVDGGEIAYDVIQPYHLEVVYTAGNDGFEPVSRVRLANATDRHLRAHNLEFRVPRLSAPDRYRLRVEGEDWDGAPIAPEARVRAIEDLGDGSVSLAVEVPLPPAVAFYVTVEAREDEARTRA